MKIKILHNARFYTGDPQRPWAEVLALVDGKVAGLDADTHLWAVPQAEIEDLDGATVIPGIVDAHIHLMWYGLSLQELDVRDGSRGEMLAQVQARAAELEPGDWILGRGWDQNLWDDSRFPTAAELDRVAPEHPVALVAKNAHALVANSAAIRAAGVDAHTEDPEHGKIAREPDGSPRGVFFEHAMHLIEAARPAPTLDDVVEALDQAQDRLLAAGITSIHDVDGAPAFAAFQELRRSERLRVRVVKYVRRAALKGVLAAGIRSGLGDDWLRFGGLKLYADGALGARTGALFAPYEGEPDNVGLLTLEPEALLELARRAAGGGVAMAIHAIGDRANRIVLDTLEAVRDLGPHLRHRIEHVQLIDPADQGRLAEAGIVASMQPIHAPHDMAMVERYWGDRAANAYAWRSLLDAGTVLAFGADAPIEPFDPLRGLYAAVTRRNEAGEPGPDGWHPEQRLTLEEALRAYTWGGAYAAGLESRLGLLLPGYHADLVALDRDIFSEPPEALLETRVLRTMVGGEWR